MKTAEVLLEKWATLIPTYCEYFCHLIRITFALIPLIHYLINPNGTTSTTKWWQHAQTSQWNELRNQSVKGHDFKGSSQEKFSVSNHINSNKSIHVHTEGFETIGCKILRQYTSLEIQQSFLFHV